MPVASPLTVIVGVIGSLASCNKKSRRSDVDAYIDSKMRWLILLRRLRVQYLLRKHGINASHALVESIIQRLDGLRRRTGHIEAVAIGMSPRISLYAWPGSRNPLHACSSSKELVVVSHHSGPSIDDECGRSARRTADRDRSGPESRCRAPC